MMYSRDSNRKAWRVVVVYVSCAAFVMPDAAAVAQGVLPQNGRVAAGSAAIGTASNGSLTVTQSSQRAIINWDSFSVGPSNTVNFVQPGAGSAILNRVTGDTPSSIAGQINANGQVYLINPNGIQITSTGVVRAAGFVASTLDIANNDFMAGRLAFAGQGASAGVSNAGRVLGYRGGFAALLGGDVANSGTISVPRGRIALGSGERATLDVEGDGFLQISGPSVDRLSPLVSNTGRLAAAGGRIEVRAAARATRRATWSTWRAWRPRDRCAATAARSSSTAARAVRSASAASSTPQAQWPEVGRL